MQKLSKLLQERILLLDGALGTVIQGYQLTEEDFRGERFKNHGSNLKGNNDLLCITQPEIIKEIHRKYLEAGSDIIETNTFSSTTIAQADYQLEDLAFELNKQSAQIAREVADEFNKKTPKQPRFVAGSIGPTNKTLSLSPDVTDPGFRAVTFDQIAEAYYEQVSGLVAGGSDILLIETIFDTLNAKAAIYAIKKYFRDKGIDELPIMISGTITDNSGRTLSGQTLSAFYTSIVHAQPLSVGLNCALGGKELRPYIEELSGIADCFVSCYPNAGLPNAMAEYDETPQDTAKVQKEFAEAGFVNIVGGCCGTTPEHIRAIGESVKGIKPRRLHS